ncbi:MAG TPA: rhodanese-like domain-containing protein [Pontiella sp.]
MNRKILLGIYISAISMAGLMVAEACSTCGCATPPTPKKPAPPTCKDSTCAITAGQPACSTCSESKSVHAENLTTEEMKVAVKSKGAILLDARTGKYFDGELIPGATHLAADSEKETIEQTVPDKNATIITYCSNTKCPASKILAEKLVELGYTDVSEYPEGIAGWKAADGAVEKSE